MIRGAARNFSWKGRGESSFKELSWKRGLKIKIFSKSTINDVSGVFVQKTLLEKRPKDKDFLENHDK